MSRAMLMLGLQGVQQILVRASDTAGATKATIEGITLDVAKVFPQATSLRFDPFPYIFRALVSCLFSGQRLEWRFAIALPSTTRLPAKTQVLDSIAGTSSIL